MQIRTAVSKQEELMQSRTVNGKTVIGEYDPASYAFRFVVVERSTFVTREDLRGHGPYYGWDELFEIAIKKLFPKEPDKT